MFLKGISVGKLAGMQCLQYQNGSLHEAGSKRASSVHMYCRPAVVGHWATAVIELRRNPLLDERDESEGT